MRYRAYRCNLCREFICNLATDELFPRKICPKGFGKPRFVRIKGEEGEKIIEDVKVVMAEEGLEEEE